MNGGLNAASSAELSDEKIKANWGKTIVGGKNRWMKYAPDVKYENGVDPKWMREQLVTDVMSQGVIAEDLEAFSDSLILEASPESVSKPNPDYLIFQQTATGEVLPLRSPNGTQQTWRPDYQTSPMYKRLLKKYNGDAKAAMIAGKRARNQAVAESNIQSIREGF